MTSRYLQPLVCICAFLLVSSCSQKPQPKAIIAEPAEKDLQVGKEISLVVEMTKPIEGVNVKWRAKGKIEPVRPDGLAAIYTAQEPGADIVTAEVWKNNEYLGMATRAFKIEGSSVRDGKPPPPSPASVTELFDGFENEGLWHVRSQKDYGPDKFRGTAVTQSANFRSEGSRAVAFSYGVANGENEAAAFYRRASLSLAGYSRVIIDVSNPEKQLVGFRLGMSGRGVWCKHQGNGTCPPNSNATIEFDLDSPIDGQRIDSGIARVVLIVDPSASTAGKVYVDNMRFAKSRAP